MRFHFNDTRRHRRLTKGLAAALRKAGRDVGHTEAADIAARLYGYADRHELDACAGAARVPASRWDEDEAPSVVETRRRRHVEVLVAAGLAPEHAPTIVSALRPTAQGRRRPDATVRPAQAKDNPEVPRASGIAGLLDRWETERAVNADPDVRSRQLFAYLVARAYELASDGLVFTLDKEQGRHSVTTEGTETFCIETGLTRNPQLIHGGPPNEAWAMHEWLASAGDIVTVGYAELQIPVELTPARTGSKQIVVAKLLLNRVPSAPTLAESGIEGTDDWTALLASRPGFHVLCSDFGFARMVESARLALAPLGIPTLAPMTPGIAHANLLRDRHRKRWRSPEKFVTPPGPPSLVVTMRWMPDSPRTVMDLVEEGRALILMVSSDTDEPSTPDGFVQHLLLSGMPTWFVRRYLISTGTRLDRPPLALVSPRHGWELGSEGMRWRIERFGPAEPDAEAA